MTLATFSASEIISINPATGEEAGRVQETTAEELNRVVDAAWNVFRTSGWKDLLPHQRADILRAIADGLLTEKEELALMQMRDNGKPLSECRGMVDYAVGTFRYYAGAVETMETEVTPPRGKYVSLTVLEPYGVVAAITPWNSPIMNDATKVAPALSPPAMPSSSSHRKIRRCWPENWCALHWLAACPTVSCRWCRARARVSAPRWSPIRACAWCPLPAAPAPDGRSARSPQTKLCRLRSNLAASRLTWSLRMPIARWRWLLSCQAFSALRASPALPDRGCSLSVRSMTRFLSAIVARAAAIRIGAPDEAGTEMGPLASFHHRERVEAFVERARAEGGRILCGGARPKGAAYEKGAYYRPTVIDGLDPESLTCQEEAFGPVLVAPAFRWRGQSDRTGQWYGFRPCLRHLDRELPQGMARRARA